ncbi:hypothetical protein L1887_55105 [Cichorium endivia]|nr:hypothetical protein L1887_55105 [Cichorium endivia]
MHTAFDCAPLLTGIKARPEAITTHAGKLYIGSSTGSLAVYKTHPASPTASGSEPVQYAPNFARRQIDQLGVVKEANVLVSLSDACVALHDLSTLELRTQLTQTKGATTFGIDTSIQKRVAPATPDYGPGPLGARTTKRAGAPWGSTATVSRAFKPGAVGDQTQSAAGGVMGTQAQRNRSSVFDVPSKDWQTASMRGMDAMVKYREEERRKAMEGARFGGAAADAQGQEGIMTLVTVLAVGVKRKLLLFRWVDGEFWDTREVALQHTPRSLAFVTPTRLFMGYNATEYGTIAIPLAAESTVAYTHPSSAYGSAEASLRRGAHVKPPTNSTAGPLVDLTAPNPSCWHVDDFDLANTNVAADAGQTGSSTGASTGISIAAGAGAGFGAALGGLGGYMGLAGKGRMAVLHVDGGEVLFVRDGTGIFLGADGRPTRREGVEWSATPQELAFAKPYVFAVLPSGSVPSLKNSSLPNAHHPVLQIRSVGTLFAVQTLCFPPAAASGAQKPASSASSPPQVRLLTPSSGNKPPMYVVVTPTDRTMLEREGSTVWQLEMHGWGQQINELVEQGEFEEALGLLDSVDNVILEDKDERRAHVQSLFALALFADERFDEAIEMFMELDTNPAKVIALYPAAVAGELSRSRDEWFPIFGGKMPARLRGDEASVGSPASGPGSLPSQTQSLATSATNAARSRLGAFLPTRRPQSIVGEPHASSSLSSSPSQAGSSKPKPTRTATGATTASSIATAKAEADQHAEAASIRSVRTTKDAPEMKATGSAASRDSRGTAATTTTTTATAAASDASWRKALDALGKFLADRRRIFKPILEASPQHESKDHMAMSQIKRDTNWLLSLPNKPFGEMDKDELIAVAQTVEHGAVQGVSADQAGADRPAVPHRELVRGGAGGGAAQGAQQVFGAHRAVRRQGDAQQGARPAQAVRRGRGGHPRRKLRPTIQYLQNLGPEFIELIVESSHWLLEVDAELGIEVFTADTGKVGSWPRLEIVDDLNKFDKRLCAVYLEYIIDHAGEADPELHDKLIKLYLRQAAQLQGSAGDRSGSSIAAASSTRDEGEGQDEDERAAVMQKLLRFLRTSTRVPTGADPGAAAR